MDDGTRANAAGRLAKSEDDRTPIPPLTDTWPDMDAADAYAIQLLNINRRIAAGAQIRGHKIGLSSRAMQRMMHVDEPDYGHLLSDMFIYDASDIDTRRYCQPRVEAEIAFILGDRLEGPGCTVADVLRATDYIVPAIELIDSRIQDWKIKLPDTIADNASSGGVILGGNGIRLDRVDIRLLGTTLSVNGEIVETGAAAAVLGNPITAVAWLANAVHRYGVSLEAGQVVLSGSCTRAVDVAAGDFVDVEFAALGRVSARFV